MTVKMDQREILVREEDKERMEREDQMDRLDSMDHKDHKDAEEKLVAVKLDWEEVIHAQKCVMVVKN